jgi:hypothetical protein
MVHECSVLDVVYQTRFVLSVVLRELQALLAASIQQLDCIGAISCQSALSCSNQAKIASPAVFMQQALRTAALPQLAGAAAAMPHCYCH